MGFLLEYAIAMKHNLQIIFSFCVVLFITGCYTTSFLPQTHNVPLFTKKNQVRINPIHSLRVFDLQLAYAPINNLGIIANIQGTTRYYMTEMGAGAFYSPTNFLVTELYGGLGTGRLKDSIIYHDFPVLPSDDRYLGIDVTAYKFFIQPNIGVAFSEKIDLSFSAKCTYWYYTNYYYNYERWERVRNSSGPKSTLAYAELINVKNGSEITIEPALTFRIGREHTKFMIQTGISTSLRTGAYNLDPYRYNNAYMRLGVSVNFNLFKKETKTNALTK